MDKQALDNLVAAYAAAPSSELATIIVFAFINNKDFSRLANYIPSLNTSLNDDQLTQLASADFDDRAENSLLKYSEQVAAQTVTSLIEKLIDAQKVGLAKRLYQNSSDANSSSRNMGLEKKLGIDNSRAKLTVVEKADVADITDLNRYREKATDFKDVVGLSAIKKQIHKKIILPFQSPSLFQRFKKKVGGGVLLYGPPGCGKTLLARATAGECNASFFNVEVSDVLDMYIGESEQKLHAIFEKARNETPSVLFFDELEALAGKREHSRNNTTANIVSQFLTELDGFAQNNDGVLVLASTNVPWSVDSAFLRPGRFDRMFFVTPPDKPARQAILEHHIKDRPADDSIDFKLIATKTSGYSGADLANLIEMAADEAIDDSIEKGSEVDINFSHFKEALSQSRDTTTEWITTARNYARYANDGGRYNDVLDFIKKNGKS